MNATATDPAAGTDTGFDDLDLFNLESHPYAAIFPKMVGEPLRELVSSIVLNGLREPIVLLGDRILDGQNRYAACCATNHPDRHWRFVRFEDIAPPGTDPLEWVMDRNQHRRHLSRNAKAAAAAAYKEIITEQARQRQRQAAARTNQLRFGLTEDREGEGSEEGRELSSAPADPHAGRRAREVAAERFDTSARSVQSATTIRRQGVPGLVEAHRSDRVSTSVGEQIARLPADTQQDIVDAIHQAPDAAASRKVAREQLNAHTTRSRSTPPPPLAPAAPPAAPQTAVVELAEEPAESAVDVSDIPIWHAPYEGEVTLDRRILRALLDIATTGSHPDRAQAVKQAQALLQQDGWAGAHR